MEHGIRFHKAIWILTILFASAILSTLIVRHPTPFRIDLRLSHSIQNRPLESLAAIGNDLAYWPVLVVMAIVVGVLLTKLRRFDGVVLMVVTIALRPINGWIKELIERPRPTSEQVRVLATSDGWSFPSGHAFGSALFYGALIVVLWRSSFDATVRRVFITVALLIVLLCGVARIYVGAHWPTDVGGAWLNAAFLLILMAWLAEKVQSRIGPSNHFDPDIGG